MSDDWDGHWERYAAATEQNPAHAFRRELILSSLALEHTQRVQLVDLGSGQGDFARELLARFPHAQVLGLEASAEGVRRARLNVPGARFEQVDLTRAHEPALPHWATHAVCSEVLEHLDDPVSFLTSSTRWCAPGCEVVVTVPAGPRTAFDRHLGHRRHFTRRSLHRVLTDAGLTVERITSAGFPFFNLYRLAVIARGQRLVNDVAHTPSTLAHLAMKTFDTLFRFNLPQVPLGWQLVARARVATR